MSSRLDHRLASRTRLTALPLLALAVLACALMQVSPAPASAASPSPYPAGATRALRIAKPSELAHAAASAPTGGSTAPGTPRLRGAPPSPRPALQAQAQAETRPARRPRARGDRLRSDAAQLLHRRVRPVRGRTVLLPVVLLAGARGDRDDVPRDRHRHESPACPHVRAGTERAYVRSALLPGHQQLGSPEGSFTSSLAAFDGTVVPPAGPGRDEVLRRQRVGRDRADAHLRARPTTPPRSAAPRRSWRS